MASVSSLGVGTSLDLDTLYTSLETAEKTKLTAITKQQTTIIPSSALIASCRVLWPRCKRRLRR